MGYTKCKKCENVLMENDLFCSQCGAPVEDEGINSNYKTEEYEDKSNVLKDFVEGAGKEIAGKVGAEIGEHAQKIGKKIGRAAGKKLDKLADITMKEIGLKKKNPIDKAKELIKKKKGKF